MASLWNFVTKGKVGCGYADLEAVFNGLIAIMRKYPPHLVNVTDLVCQMKADETVINGALDFTPCHRNLWLEWLDPDVQMREALHVSRISAPNAPSRQEPPEGARHYVQVDLWREWQASAVLVAVAGQFIDQMGQPCTEDFGYYCSDKNNDATEWRMMAAQEIITIMNTRGTRIEPPLDKLPAEIVKPNRAPHSVWHTIHLPRFQSPPLENAVIDGAVLERRQHWVRAHRKDYRQGAGMFGRVKALVWVPEHQRGNPELGTVMQSYSVDPKDHYA